MIKFKQKKFSFYFLILLICFIFYILKNKSKADDTSYITQIIRNYTERIYKQISCHDGYCDYDKSSSFIQSEELFTFYGYDANCDYFNNTCNKTYNCDKSTNCSYEKDKCKKNNNNKDCVDCTGLNYYECIEAQEECIHNETIKCYINFPYGQSGTTRTYGNIYTNGQRTFIDGYDNLGYHWFRTNPENPGGQLFALKENTRDLYFNGNLLQTDVFSNIFLNTNNNPINKIIWLNEIKKYQKSNEYIETTKSNIINFHSEHENIMEIDSKKNYNTKLKNGAETNNLLETNSIEWKGNTGSYKKLYWTPIQKEKNPDTCEVETYLFGMRDGYNTPSKENHQILFYYDSK